jgi:hypothetical protein
MTFAQMLATETAMTLRLEALAAQQIAQDEGDDTEWQDWPAEDRSALQ